MAVGISTTNVANAMLNWLRGTAPTSIAGLYVQLHTGDPGAAGTANLSALTTRIQVTMNAASGGGITMASVAGSWTMTTAETISHISVWSASTSGLFLFSIQIAASRSVLAGDTITLTSLTVSNTPLAA